MGVIDIFSKIMHSENITHIYNQKILLKIEQIIFFAQFSLKYFFITKNIVLKTRK